MDIRDFLFDPRHLEPIKTRGCHGVGFRAAGTIFGEIVSARRKRRVRGPWERGVAKNVIIYEHDANGKFITGARVRVRYYYYYYYYHKTACDRGCCCQCGRCQTVNKLPRRAHVGRRRWILRVRRFSASARRFLFLDGFLRNGYTRGATVPAIVRRGDPFISAKKPYLSPNVVVTRPSHTHTHTHRVSVNTYGAVRRDNRNFRKLAKNRATRTLREFAWVATVARWSNIRIPKFIAAWSSSTAATNISLRKFVLFRISLNNINHEAGGEGTVGMLLLNNHGGYRPSVRIS